MRVQDISDMDGCALLRVLLAAGVPQPHRFIMWRDWMCRQQPLLRAAFDRIAKFEHKP
jgi:hypothetical protein